MEARGRVSAVNVQRAFELHGQIRERLTQLQSLAADLEDPQLSMAVRGAMTANTAGLTRTNDLLQATKPTDPLDADLDSQNAERVS
jgi:hypothetical protein